MAPVIKAKVQMIRYKPTGTRSLSFFILLIKVSVPRPIGVQDVCDALITSSSLCTCELIFPRIHSGCKDEQTSSDVSSAATFGLPANVGPGGAGGACTNAMMSIFYNNNNVFSFFGQNIAQHF